MSAVQRQVTNLRDEYAAMTRQRIIAAYVETLEDEIADDTSMAAVARRAGIAERTIYRHFKSRAELMDAAGEWIEDNVFGYIPFSAPDELPAIFRELCRRYDRHPQLARALALTRAGRSLRAQFRRRLIQQHRKAMAPLVRNLPAKQARQAEALAAYLNNTLAWNTLREDFGLSSSEIADAVEWATTTLLEDVRRRDAAAAPAGASPRKRSTATSKVAKPQA
jgi:AcrR family transcriptional regulator